MRSKAHSAPWDNFLVKSTEIDLGDDAPANGQIAIIGDSGDRGNASDDRSSDVREDVSRVEKIIHC